MPYLIYNNIESEYGNREVWKSMIKLKFGKKPVVRQFDGENYKPVLKCSICTGERVAGFKDIHSGKFEEVMLIRNERELETFMQLYDVKDIIKEY